MNRWFRKAGLFDNSPWGARMYATGFDGGIWLPVPLYRVARWLRSLHIAYLEWKLGV